MNSGAPEVNSDVPEGFTFINSVFVLAIALSVIRVTASDYPFNIVNLFLMG
jgi:hypothetical protein